MTTETQTETLTPEQRAHLLQWAEALESGKYKQGRNQLINNYMIGDPANYTYCCLGVACEILPKEEFGAVVDLAFSKPRTESLPEEIDEYYGLHSDSCCTTRTTSALCDDIEASHFYPDIALKDYLSTLPFSRLNDCRGASFVDIAAHIRRVVKRSKELESSHNGN